MCTGNFLDKFEIKIDYSFFFISNYIKKYFQDNILFH